MSEKCGCHVGRAVGRAPFVKHCALHGAAEAMRDALAGLFGYVEDGTLLRNIENDGEPGWALRALPFVTCLKKADEALRAAGTGKGAP